MSIGIPKLKIRGFEAAKGWENKEIILPVRSTRNAAAYDFFAPCDLVVMPNSMEAPTLLPTGIKAYMRPDEVLVLAARSSSSDRGLVLANSIGIVDADFFGNVSNDGHIFFKFWNLFEDPIWFKKGHKMGQGMFLSFLKADDDDATAERVGGNGSSGA